MLGSAKQIAESRAPRADAMVAHMLKLAYFLIERVAEPLSGHLERVAARSPRFRSMCGGIAQQYNALEFNKAERRRRRDAAEGARADGWEGAGEAEPAPQLCETEATRLGCSLLGEGFVIMTGCALLVHQSTAESEAEEEQQRAIDALERAQRGADARLAELEAAHRRLVDELGEAHRAGVAIGSRSRTSSARSRWWGWAGWR